MVWNHLKSIFQNASTTYFYSHLFFPSEIQKKVKQLYGFVRVADDMVDRNPPQVAGIKKFIDEYRQSKITNDSPILVIAQFLELEKQEEFKEKWVWGFFQAMTQDLVKKKYQTIDETIQYMYGSAEVIGLMMASILDLPEDSHTAARLQGRAMQYINFLRDINEDLALGRQYIPQESLDEVGLTSLDFETVSQNEAAFKALISNEIQRYFEWQAQAENGYRFIPYRYRVAIKTASDMYNWTAHQILKDPMKIYKLKLKPSKWWVLATGLKNSVTELVS